LSETVTESSAMSFSLHKIDVQQILLIKWHFANQVQIKKNMSFV